MRTIKFRAKRIDTGAWVYGHYGRVQNDDSSYDDFIKEDTTRHISNVTQTVFKIDPKTLCQFIGRYDWTGEEIYEGDILDIEDETVVVVWDSMTAGFSSEPKIKYAERGWDETLTDHADCIEVTGNIHDK